MNKNEELQSLTRLYLDLRDFLQSMMRTTVPDAVALAARIEEIFPQGKGIPEERLLTLTATCAITLGHIAAILNENRAAARAQDEDFGAKLDAMLEELWNQKGETDADPRGN